MATFLMLIGYWMYLDTTFTPTAVVVCVIAYNAAFGFSWGPIPWLYPPEIMPLPVRVKGVSLSTATNWAFNWLVGEATPILQERIRWRLYPMHGFFCCISFIAVYFFYPETANISLEAMVSRAVRFVPLLADLNHLTLQNVNSGRDLQRCGHAG